MYLFSQLGLFTQYAKAPEIRGTRGLVYIGINALYLVNLDPSKIGGRSLSSNLLKKILAKSTKQTITKHKISNELNGTTF